MDSNHPSTPAGANQGQPRMTPGGAPPAASPGVARPVSPGIILPTPGSSGTPGAPNQPPRPAAPATPAMPNRIQHTKPGIGLGAGNPASTPAAQSSGLEEALRPVNRLGEDAKPLPMADSAGLSAGGKITAFGGKSKRHEDSWSRSPNTTGNGAIHVKTFHCKLTDDALSYLDQGINEWLDAHPQYEVKFVSTSIGIMTGKLKEPALICQVWV